MAKPSIALIGRYSEAQLSRMQENFETHAVKTPQQLNEIVKCDRIAIEAAAFHGHVEFGGQEMDWLPALKVIANFGVGYDSIDIGAANARDIIVTNTPDVLNDDVADLAVGMYLSLQRRIPDGDAWVRTGDWASKGTFPLNSKASGAKIGILGMGRVGREIADRMAAFKAEIHYQSRRKKEVPLGWIYHADALSLASAVDVLFVAIVGGEETKGLVSAEILDALGKNGIIVNVSRGSVIDEEALIIALRKNRLSGAALDVFLNEPHIDPRLIEQPNVLLQPHQGSGTRQTRKAMADLQYENIAAFFDKRPLPTAVNGI